MTIVLIQTTLSYMLNSLEPETESYKKYPPPLLQSSQESNSQESNSQSPMNLSPSESDPWDKIIADLENPESPSDMHQHPLCQKTSLL